MDNHKMYAPCWQTTNEQVAQQVMERYRKIGYHLFNNYCHRTGETQWFYEDEGLSKIFIVAMVDTPRGRYYYKNINVIK